MGHLRQLIDTKRTPRNAHPRDSFTKTELWERLQAAERALTVARNSAQSMATQAHDYAQGATGEQRRQFLSLRDAAYAARG
jgi:hypothetical protein